jgi:hypothetical protein
MAFEKSGYVQTGKKVANELRCSTLVDAVHRWTLAREVFRLPGKGHPRSQNSGEDNPKTNVGNMEKA